MIRKHDIIELRDALIQSKKSKDIGLQDYENSENLMQVFK